MAKYSGVSRRMLDIQAAERRQLKAAHAAQRKKLKSYGKKGAAAAANRARTAVRQAREMAELVARQEAELESARSQYRITEAKRKAKAAALDWDTLKQWQRAGQITDDDFRTENFRLALINNSGLSGKAQEEFEKIIKDMSKSDITNLSNMYSNVLETWKDSEGYFSAIGNELISKIRGMAKQTTKNIARMVRQGESKLDDETIRLAMEGWNFRLHTTRETLKEMGIG